MKRLLIPGAGIYQVPLIRKAREMGIYTITASTPGRWPGFSHADRVLEVDTTDCEGMLRAAERENIDGIVTTGTDVAVRSIGLICDRLGLRGISAAAAELLTDKAKMKEAFRGIVATSPFRRAFSLREAELAAEEIGYPVMVKAVDVSGSRGVTRVDAPSALPGAVRDALSAGHARYFLVEGVSSGTEIGLDAFVEDGKVRAFFPHRKFIRKHGGRTIPAGHAFPFGGSAPVKAALLEELEHIIAATGLDNCAVNCDIMVDGENVSVIEAGGRCGATCIPELIEEAAGIDYYRQMILCALGEPTDFMPVRDEPCMAKLLLSDVPGRVKRVDEAALESLRNKYGAVIMVDVQEGDEVRAAGNGTDRIGHVLLRTGDENELDFLVKKTMEAIEMR